MTSSTSADDRRIQGLQIVPGAIADGLDRTLADIERERVVERLFANDHTLWSASPDEITNRLGWLAAADNTAMQLDRIHELAAAVKTAGVRHIVLLGMGGSSLGAEAIRAIVAAPTSAPELIVLDSTVPAQVEAVKYRIDPGNTLFIVASKSGTTAEVAALRELFWAETAASEKGVGVERAGDRFLAVTDPDSPLAELAAARSFRHCFLNPPDIGGRFSVLSLYGAVPTGLAGIDVGGLVAHGRRAAAACRAVAGEPRRDRGVVLGALLGAAARAGRDKLTLSTSPALNAFGLWAEQLVAESTGKVGRGILPIAGEPLLAAEAYGSDRVFVTLRLAGDEPTPLDELLPELHRTGHPHVDLTLDSRVGLGAEFFHWQVATAIAGHLLRVHPFDQPDVEATKIETRRLLATVERGEALPSVADDEVLPELERNLPSAPYLAVMAYVAESAAFEEAIDALRRAVGGRYGIATTFGYGPRFLHSTGQYHKGGPAGGIHLQLLSIERGALPLPGASYGLGDLAYAQALGDRRALIARGRACLSLDLSTEPVRRVQDLARSLADG